MIILQKKHTNNTKKFYSNRELNHYLSEINNVLTNFNILVDEDMTFSTTTFNNCKLTTFSSCINIKVHYCLFSNCLIEDIKLYSSKISNSSFNKCKFKNIYLINTVIDQLKIVNTKSIYNVNLYDCIEEGTIISDFPQNYGNKIPEGTLIGYKRVKDNLITLEIPKDAQRIGTLNKKCRCEYAKVLSIYNITTKTFKKIITNENYEPLVYKVNSIIKPDFFDNNIFKTCSHGIHFFLNVWDCLEYNNPSCDILRYINDENINKLRNIILYN